MLMFVMSSCLIVVFITLEPDDNVVTLRDDINKQLRLHENRQECKLLSRPTEGLVTNMKQANNWRIGEYS